MLLLMLVAADAYPCLADRAALYRPRLRLLRRSPLLPQLAADYTSTVKTRCACAVSTQARSPFPETTVQSIYDSVIWLRYADAISTEGEIAGEG